MHGANMKIHSWYFVYGGTCTTTNYLPFQKPVFVESFVKSLVGWWIRLVFLALWSQFEASSLSLELGPSSTSV